MRGPPSGGLGFSRGKSEKRERSQTRTGIIRSAPKGCLNFSGGKKKEEKGAGQMTISQVLIDKGCEGGVYYQEKRRLRELVVCDVVTSSIERILERKKGEGV